MPLEQPNGGPTVLRILLGAQLRRLREAAGIDMERAGKRIRGSKAKISRMETGQVGFKLQDVADLLSLYGIKGQDKQQERKAFLDLVRQANQPGWWQKYSEVLPDWFQTYVGLEQAAAQIRVYEPQIIPGLFQTEAYARAIISSSPWRPTLDEVEQRVNLRIGRQHILTRPAPCRLWAIIDERALHRPVGGPAVQRAQLEHLLELIKLPNITLQVLPGDATRLIVGGPFVILRFAEVELPDLVYVEQLTGAFYLDTKKENEKYEQVMSLLAVASRKPVATPAIIQEVLDGQ